jgi:hypothetical protein
MRLDANKDSIFNLAEIAEEVCRQRQRQRAVPAGSDALRLPGGQCFSSPSCRQRRLRLRGSCHCSSSNPSG